MKGSDMNGIVTLEAAGLAWPGDPESHCKVMLSGRFIRYAPIGAEVIKIAHGNITQILSRSESTIWQAGDRVRVRLDAKMADSEFRGHRGELLGFTAEHDFAVVEFTSSHPGFSRQIECVSSQSLETLETPDITAPPQEFRDFEQIAESIERLRSEIAQQNEEIDSSGLPPMAIEEYKSAVASLEMARARMMQCEFWRRRESR